MSHYRYGLAPYVWVAGPPRGRWGLPPGAAGGVDLRSLAQTSAQGGTPRGHAFCAGLQPPGGVELAAGDHMSETAATALMRSAWQSAAGRSPQGDTLTDMLWDQLTAGSDPSGLAGPKPLMPGVDGTLRLHVGGHSEVKAERFRWGRHPHTGKVQDALRLDFERLFEEEHKAMRGRPPRQHRKVLDFWRKKYRLEDWRAFVPPALLAHVEGPLPHETVIAESFNTADSDTLGPDLSWTELEGDVDVASNKASAGGGHRARAEHDLSSGDHYGQAKVGTDADGNGYPAVLCRKGPTATATFYQAEAYFTEQATHLVKYVASSATDLGSVSHAFSVGTEYVLKVQADGSTVKLFVDGAEKVSVTDTAVTGGLRCGLGGFKGGAGRNTWDDFEAADLAVPPGGNLAMRRLAMFPHCLPRGYGPEGVRII